MAVTITWYEWTGADTAGWAGNLMTSLNFGSTDAVDLTPATYPISAGSNSFHKNVKMQFSGSYTQIDNVRVYKESGTYRTNELMLFSGSTPWVTPAADATGYNAIPTTLPIANVGLKTVGTPSSGTLPRSTETNSSPGYYSGSRTNLMTFQSTTGSDTEAGATLQKTIKVTYDIQ